MNLETARALRREGRHEQACELLVQLAARMPDNADVQYEAACVHDALGRERDAVPYYQRAIAGGLDPEPLRSAYLGLGSTYRALGEHARACEVFDQGLSRFPGAAELIVFRAMARHNLGHSKEAVESLLTVIAATSSDPHLRQYGRAIAFYAEDIDRSWP